jgi:hypothetical protein
VLGQVVSYGLIFFSPLFFLGLESIKCELSCHRWPGGSKSSGGDALFEPLDRLSGAIFPQYKVKWLYHLGLVRCACIKFRN